MNQHRYLNPTFTPQHKCKERLQKHATSSLAYDLHAVINTLFYASDNDGREEGIEHRGIVPTLEIALHMASDLIDRCEELEREAIKPS